MTSTNEQTLPILLHLKELRKRLLWCFGALAFCTIPAFFVYDNFINLLIAPFEKIGILAGGKPLYITSIFEGFLMNLKYSLILGAILSLPVHLYHIIRFIFPGLKKKERIVIAVTLLCSTALALLSLYFVYYFMLPLSINMLMTRSFIPEKVGLILSFQNSVSYIFDFLLYGMLTFQFPIVLEVLLYLNIIKRKTLWKASRYVIIFILIIAAIVTPPDAISQVSFAIPMILLYFLTLLIAKICKFGEGT